MISAPISGRRIALRVATTGTGRGSALWHSAANMTDHYTMAQIKELFDALEKVAKPANSWNRSLHSLKAEAAARRVEQAGGTLAEGESRKSPAGKEKGPASK